MTGIKRRLADLEEKLGMGQEPITITIEKIITDDGVSGEVHIIRVKYNPDGTVEHLGEEVRDWQEEENP